MTALALYYVVFVHVLAACFFVGRFVWRARKRLPGYSLTGMFVYLSLGPAAGAARELGWLRGNSAVILALLAVIFGTLLLVTIWSTHFRRGAA